MFRSQSRTAFLYKLWAVLVVGGITFIDLFHRFYPAWAIYGAFDDDFFYYALVAKHLAHGDGSTFDGIHLTNGYHPLWLLWLSLFSAIDHGRFLFPLVTLTAVLSLACIFALSLRCLRRLGVELQGQYAIATLITFWSDLLLRGGMEITLALPLLLLLLFLWLDPQSRSLGSFFRLGLLSALCILARLDSVILITLLFVTNMIFERQQAAVWGKRILTFASGLAPFWAYLISNRIFFGNLTPISAQAKQLSLHHSLHLTPLLSLFHPLTTVRLLLVLPALLCIALLLLYLLKHQQLTANPSATPILWALALFPILQLTVLCLLSDWQLWYWYFYPLVLVSLGAIATWTAHFPLPSRIWISVSAVITIVSVGYTLTYNFSRPPRRNDTFLAARDIADFSRTHPGIYAMGDRSGTVAWLLPSPLIQLEGLVMDRDYLEKLRAEPPLKSLLREYGVQYYVSTNPVYENGCYLVREPAQPGSDSAHMTGTFCQSPEATFSHNGIVTHIFSVADTSQTGN
jgi:hypothetical protein